MVWETEAGVLGVQGQPEYGTLSSPPPNPNKQTNTSNTTHTHTKRPDMVVYTFNFSIWEVEAGGARELKGSLIYVAVYCRPARAYIVRPCFRTETKANSNNKIRQDHGWSWLTTDGPGLGVDGKGAIQL